VALFLTFFIMAPTWSKVYSQAVAPYMAEKITVKEAYDKAMVPLRDFMFRQVKERDLGLFVRLAKIKEPKNRKDVPTYVLVPAFVTSELATAFEIGFLIFIPFLIIDLVIASILMSMGMLMLPPVMISLPFKLLLFVLVDGWSLMISSLVRSFG
jgi:flagellar biosynthetic protein FliP